MQHNKNRSGFTLIEMLVVVAIIGLLSSVVVVGLGSARQNARDARRISDIRQIQNALEVYYSSNGSYPADLTSLTIPHDPLDDTMSYGYSQLSSGQGYAVGACLEGGRPEGTNHYSADVAISNFGTCNCNSTADTKVFCASSAQ